MIPVTSLKPPHKYSGIRGGFFVTYFQRREANRYYFYVKGQLIPENWTDNEVMKIYDSYFSRLWGNNEKAEYCDFAFRQAWDARQLSKKLV